jgi:hypothetical protein
MPAHDIERLKRRIAGMPKHPVLPSLCTRHGCVAIMRRMAWKLNYRSIAA